LVKDGCAYLQAGGGIVFDSNEEDEYHETINKMAALGKAITQAEEHTKQISQPNGLLSPYNLTASVSIVGQQNNSADITNYNLLFEQLQFPAVSNVLAVPKEPEIR